MKLKICACLLLLTMATTVVSSALPAFAEDTVGAETVSSSVLSPVTSAYNGIKEQLNGYTGHGQNQTRMVSTDSGVYMASLGDPDSNQMATGGLWKINDDGTCEMLKTFPIGGIAAGGTTQAMQDKDGNIWAATTWDGGSGIHQLRAYKYDPKTGEVTSYEAKGLSMRGGNYGKASAIIDPDFNRIYVFASGNMTPGYFMWTYFDITTGQWEKNIKSVKMDVRGDYHYAYPDGKGGFITVCETCTTPEAAKTNIEGMTAREAMDTLRSYKAGPYYLWMEPRLLYVPDVTEEKLYVTAVETAKFDVEKGYYPQVWNANDDLYWDKTNNRLYVICTLEDNGVAGHRIMLYIYDTSKVNENIAEDGVFPKLVEKEISFVYGGGHTYSQHFYQDTTGQLWIVAFFQQHGAVEIWKLDDPLCSSMHLVHYEALSGALSYETTGVSTVVATNRNNSVMDDTAEFGLCAAGGWWLLRVDFAALRAKLG